MRIRDPHNSKRSQHPIQVMVPRELETALEDEAARAGVSRSEIIRRACEALLESARSKREAAERRARLLAARGIAAHVSAGSDVFAARRAVETAREDDHAVRT